MSDDHPAWHATVELPVGLAGEDHEQARQQATLRKMTGNEEALLADPKLRGNGGRLVSALLASCITSLGGNGRVTPDEVRRLASADRNYLLLELRRLTFGDEMEARYRCPRCQAVTAVVEDLTSLEVRRVPGDAATPEIAVTLRDGYADPDGNWHHEFVFALPTGADEEAAGSRRDANPARQRDALLARCLRRAGTLEPRRAEAFGTRIFADLSMADRRLIHQALDERAPGPDLTRRVVCEHCEEEFRTALDMSHFFPLA